MPRRGDIVCEKGCRTKHLAKYSGRCGTEDRLHSFFTVNLKNQRNILSKPTPPGGWPKDTVQIIIPLEFT